MNYEKLYLTLIETRKNKGIPEGYREVHHIIPRSFGGTDEENNLIAMTAREHFIAHRLLAKIYPNSGMVHAVYKMACSNLTMKRYKVTNRVYEQLRINHAYRVSNDEVAKLKKSIAGKGKKQDPNHIRARTESRRNNGPWLSEETKIKIGKGNRGKEGTWANKKLPKEMIDKMVQTRKADGSYSWTEERKEQQRNRLSINPVPPRSFTEQHKEQLRNEKSIKVTCPHCGKEGTMLIMPRWHFNNCKKRP